MRTIGGLEQARFLQHGYAVEYDFVQPSQLDVTLGCAGRPGPVSSPGRSTGTSGYEEAAAQGLIAGANAALWLLDREPLVLGRHEAYIGVLVDDLVVTSPSEPYRMFTSRAEYRLLLRQDNADARLVPLAHAVGLVPAEKLEAYRARERKVAEAKALLERLREDGKSLAELLRRPAVRAADLFERREELRALGLEGELVEALEADIKYAGYVEHQLEDVARLRRQETTPIPGGFAFEEIEGLGAEARQRLRSYGRRRWGRRGGSAGCGRRMSLCWRCTWSGCGGSVGGRPGVGRDPIAPASASELKARAVHRASRCNGMGTVGCRVHARPAASRRTRFGGAGPPRTPPPPPTQKAVHRSGS